MCFFDDAINGQIIAWVTLRTLCIRSKNRFFSAFLNRNSNMLYQFVKVHVYLVSLCNELVLNKWK